VRRLVERIRGTDSLRDRNTPRRAATRFYPYREFCVNSIDLDLGAPKDYPGCFPSQSNTAFCGYRSDLLVTSSVTQ